MVPTDCPYFTVDVTVEGEVYGVLGVDFHPSDTDLLRGVLAATLDLMSRSDQPWSVNENAGFVAVHGTRED